VAGASEPSEDTEERNKEIYERSADIHRGDIQSTGLV